jgi:hypothetical protein
MYRVGQGKDWSANTTTIESGQMNLTSSKTGIRFADANPPSKLVVLDERNSNWKSDLARVEGTDVKVNELESGPRYGQA